MSAGCLSKLSLAVAMVLAGTCVGCSNVTSDDSSKDEHAIPMSVMSDSELAQLGAGTVHSPLDSSEPESESDKQNFIVGFLTEIGVLDSSTSEAETSGAETSGIYGKGQLGADSNMPGTDNKSLSRAESEESKAHLAGKIPPEVLKLKGNNFLFAPDYFDEDTVKQLAAEQGTSFRHLNLCVANEQGKILLKVGDDRLAVNSLPIAYAFAKYSTTQKLSLDQALKVDNATLQSYRGQSPLSEYLLLQSSGDEAANYENGFEVTLKTLLSYTVSQADPLASDLLVQFMGGLTTVNRVLGTNFRYFEHEIITNPKLSAQNSLRPKQSVALVRAFNRDMSVDAAFKQVIYDNLSGSWVLDGMQALGDKAQNALVFAQTTNKAVAIIKFQGNVYYLTAGYSVVPEDAQAKLQTMVTTIFGHIK